MCKTVATKRFEAARQAWCERMRAEGKRVVSGEQYQRLESVVLLLHVATCQFHPPDKAHNDLRGRLYTLYEEARTELETLVRFDRFRMETEAEPTPAQLPDLVLLPEESEEG